MCFSTKRDLRCSTSVPDVSVLDDPQPRERLALLVVGTNAREGSLSCEAVDWTMVSVGRGGEFLVAVRWMVPRRRGQRSYTNGRINTPQEATAPISLMREARHSGSR